jgi:uncharacterized protein (TIGR00369 family)
MYSTARINAFFSPTLTISEGAAQIVVPVRPDFFHAAHAVHGAVYFKMLDEAAFFAVNSLVEDVFVLTVTFNLYLTRPVTAGILTATGRVVHASKRLYLAESLLSDEQGKELARGSGSFMKSQIALSADLGYI